MWTVVLTPDAIPEIIRQTHPDLVHAILSAWQNQPSVIWIQLPDGSEHRWVEQGQTWEQMQAPKVPLA